ncbi:heavy metal-associated isoprenylated plant protein 28-like [Pyrus x bretschneideri]|uniref:heavy metal-associated isoprenylated plant protein 28-like n=1 Tax=Pyrus x bretschneideri TaxID=225117 RepID=UPI00202F6D54|nr:heavy metal-associated isoprenylated plant protein 28-like [Pyrus x bretschneideri]
MADMQIVPACKNVEAQYVEMMVPLYSHGCEKKIEKTLSHLKGIYSVKVDYNEQKVTVWGICNKYDVLATVRSKRKHSCFWNSEDNIALEDQSAEPPSVTTPPPCSPPPPITTLSSFKYTKPSLALIKVRSLSWKAWTPWKKVFNRSYSLPSRLKLNVN